MNDSSYDWYSLAEQPFFAPPAWVFGVAWSILYPIIFLTFAFVFYKIYKKAMPMKVVIPFVLNLIFNFLFTPIQFYFQNNVLATIDIVLVVVTLIWAMKVVYKYFPRITYAQIPYLLWGAFATILQITIMLMN